MDRWMLWLAQGLGIGRTPRAPGTWGSLLGLIWFGVLVIPRHPAGLVGGAALGILLSIWCCGRAERLLGQVDPPSVVLDEIAAVPFCFFSWMASLMARDGHLPDPAFFLYGANAGSTAGLFLAFRCFDIIKPWPIRQSQRLPGGWGITVDDLLAALYVNGLWWIARGFGLPIS